ncbi:sortase A [Streptomyces sp. SAI-117]|uniref:class E sortase n=1 Tax=Streptomyces sp. SAI-117 TaxID=2940546 RepID=UPI00247673EB|nr:class E sortase [Streptomyces sp. SAI-117]MDH6570090.1 sortase A [Streptomyces sp. SAI-117]
MRQRITHHGTRRRRERRRRAVWAGGELLVTVGVALLLLVVHQLWWTNREAREGAHREVEALEREWERGPGVDPGSASASSEPGEAQEPLEPQQSRDSSAGQDPRPSTPTPDPSQAYAVLNIPRLHLRVPVAEGVGKVSVLDKGYVGHYPGTGQPGGVGNFALAGHRNTHGEPFRYVDRLVPGDAVRVETRGAVYTYAVDRTLRQTSARDSGVIGPVPRSTVHPAYGYSEPGHYLTLTTCTPEYTSRYRLVVWGKLVSARTR